jgi:transposase
LSGKQALKALAQGQQAAQHGLRAEGVLWILGLRARGLGAEVLRELRAGLKWQRLKSYEKFAEMIDRHWDGIAAYCEPENKVSLGFVRREHAHVGADLGDNYD